MHRLFSISMILVIGTGAASSVAALVAEVKHYKGSPAIFVNGKPVSPLMFFGWAGGRQATQIVLGREWKQYAISFEAPEDNQGRGGVHIRVGNVPGKVWIDDTCFYEGEKTDEGRPNMLRYGEWEGTKEEMAQAWVLFVKTEEGVRADWSPDREMKHSGEQSCRVEIEQAGAATWHIHFYQTGLTVWKGRRYTFSVWLKADRERAADIQVLHHGEPWMIYSGEAEVFQSQVRLAARAGVHLHSFGIPMPWPKPGEKADFSGVDEAISSVLKADPQALLLPRFGLDPPGWWLEEHPEDRMLFDDGKTEGVSVASEAWRNEMLDHLRSLVRYCEQKYGDRILGYHPCGQHTGEWFYHRSWEPRLGDFSPAMSRGFARWARSKYRTVEALRRVWKDNSLPFDRIAVPDKEEQLRTSLGFFRNPETERKVIDYFEYKQAAMAEPLEMIARVIKEETKGNKLACLFYGYIFDMHGLPMGPQGSGHLAMARLARNPDVDILCSPISYNDREPGGAGLFMSAVDTVREASKLWLNEDDTRTYLTPEDAGFGRADSREKTFQVHRRNFAQLFPRRLACWYMDLGGTGWLDGEDIWDNIAVLQRFYRQHLDSPARWSPEVALIVDETSPWYTACTSALHSPLVYQMRSQFFRMGVPFRIHLLSDLTQGRVPPARVYFFLNCFHLDKTGRDVIRRATRGKTAVWFYGGGFLDSTASDANMADAIGLKVRRAEPLPGRVTPERAGGRLSEGLSEAFGMETVLDPLWVASEEEAEVIGRYPGGGIAAAARKTPDGLRVYIGALHCPAKLLRNILKASGAHLYTDTDDVVLTDGEFFSLTATSRGKKQILFLRPHRVTDALDSSEVAPNALTLDLEMEAGETRMFRVK